MKKIKNLFRIGRITALVLLVSSFLNACSDISFYMPEGKSAYEVWKGEVLSGKIQWPSSQVEIADFFLYCKGEKGDKGDKGLSTYEMWKEMVSKGDVTNPHEQGKKWPKDRNTEPDFWNFLVGRDGNTPYIGSNGNWFIGNNDTGVGAKGEKGAKGDKGEKGKDGLNGIDGKDGKSAYEQWKNLVENGTIEWTGGNEVTQFFLYLKGAQGERGENGKDGTDGLTPRIGENGNWWIGDTDTHIKAAGDKGEKGDQGEKGETGAAGANGANGADGKSAYELWKDDVAAGKITDPKTGNTWSASEDTQTDFYRYLRGADGAKGAKGDKGETGATGATGADGAKGADGKSAYEMWKEMVSKGDVTNPHDPSKKWPAGDNKESDFWNFLIGRDGNTPYIGSNGNWFIGGEDTGKSAKGEKGKDGLNGIDGKDGQSAYEQWKKLVENGTISWTGGTKVENFFQYLKGAKGDKGDQGNKGTDGTDGLTPRIGNNGNWWIGDTDTHIKAAGEKGEKGDQGEKGNQGETGATGATGADGKSAYDLWKADVEAGNIKDPKTGADWSKAKNTQTDFFEYLRGAKGDKGATGADGAKGADGKSAYEMWKEMVSKGNVPNPQKPSEMWPKEKVSENNFFEFLTGKDGKNGLNGKDGNSAYEIWKEELKSRYNTADPLKDHRTGEVWSIDRDSKYDFFEYLRGKDGKDGTGVEPGSGGKPGADGKPGEIGEPGVVVEVIQGKRNVIAQYSQPEYGEYVRTTDGGVRYLVYDEQSEPAPQGTIVMGMPGLPANKFYTTDAEGAFIIPKEDLPDTEDMVPVEKRWGKAASVTIPGKGSKESAMNTYVPCRVHVRMVLAPRKKVTQYMDDDYNIYFYFQRKLSPKDKWKIVPRYLPKVIADIHVYEVTDKNDPLSYDVNKMIREDMVNMNGDTSENSDVRVRFTRFMKENMLNHYYVYNYYWDGGDHYYTIVRKEKYYGELMNWNGVIKMVPYQIPPLLKKIELKGFKDGELPVFESMKCTYDMTTVDRSLFFKRELDVKTLSNDIEYIEPVLYTESEANGLKPFYIEAKLGTEVGKNLSTSENNRSSLVQPVTELKGVYLGSTIKSCVASHIYYQYLTIASQRESLGTIERVPGKTNEFYFKKIGYAKPEMPDVEVVYVQ